MCKTIVVKPNGKDLQTEINKAIRELKDGGYVGEGIALIGERGSDCLVPVKKGD